MHKQMVSLTEPQIDWLKKEADRLGLSVSDLIRRVVDDYREEHQNVSKEKVR